MPNQDQTHLPLLLPGPHCHFHYFLLVPSHQKHHRPLLPDKRNPQRVQ
uniref:Uncharacterized protein n=1 Tax=Rhizophora mucronata TaxID=61149 RepID=A0A2P2PZK1_RHIMU